MGSILTQPGLRLGVLVVVARAIFMRFTKEKHETHTLRKLAAYGITAAFVALAGWVL